MTLTARHTLLIDAAATTATAILMLAGRTRLYPAFGLESPAVLDLAAIAFLIYAAVIALAARRGVSRTVVMTTAAANAGYVAASVAVLVMFWSELPPTGRALIVIVALAVEAFAMLQFSAARFLSPQGAAQPSR